MLIFAKIQVIKRINANKGDIMEDKFKFTLNVLNEQFGGRLEIDTKEMLSVIDMHITTLSRHIKKGDTNLLPKYRQSGIGKGQKTCGKYKWPIYDLAVFLTQDQSVSA